MNHQILTCLLLCSMFFVNCTNSTTKKPPEEKGVNSSNFLESDEVKQVSKDLTNSVSVGDLKSINLVEKEKEAINGIISLANIATDKGLSESQYEQLVIHTETLTVAMKADDAAGGTGVEGSNCVRRYDDCLKNHNCDDNSTVCFCCAPCSIKYAKCIAVGLIIRSKIRQEAPTDIILEAPTIVN